MDKILIIEDAPALRIQMAQVLRFEGFEALEAVNGKPDADGHITKPCAKNALLGSVRRRLEKKKRPIGKGRRRAGGAILAVAMPPLREEHLVLLVDDAGQLPPPGTPVEAAGHGLREFWSRTVSSRGASLDAGQVSRIGVFERFWTDDKMPCGPGLGRALTQGVAQLCGGEFALQPGTEITTACVLVPFET